MKCSLELTAEDEELLALRQVAQIVEEESGNKQFAKEDCLVFTPERITLV